VAQQREAEVGVVEPARLRVDGLGSGQVGQQAGNIGRIERVPQVAKGLALHTRGVGEQSPEAQLAMCGQLKVLGDRLIEIDEAGVARLQHQHGGEGLGDRADAEAGIRIERALSHLKRPRLAIVAPQRNAQGRDPVLPLGFPYQFREGFGAHRSP
jgi:hypothetical protein